MPHLDESLLHAYADGELETVAPGATVAVTEHLATCAGCDARLKAVVHLRNEAARLLLYGAPEPDIVPPFDQVVRRRHARDATNSPRKLAARPRARMAWHLAWAASLALALGAGWLAHAALHSHDEPVASRSDESVRSDESIPPTPSGDAAVDDARLATAARLAASEPSAAEPSDDAATAPVEISPESSIFEPFSNRITEPGLAIVVPEPATSEGLVPPSPQPDLTIRSTDAATALPILEPRFSPAVRPTHPAAAVRLMPDPVRGVFDDERALTNPPSQPAVELIGPNDRPRYPSPPTPTPFMEPLRPPTPEPEPSRPPLLLRALHNGALWIGRVIGVVEG